MFMNWGGDSKLSSPGRGRIRWTVAALVTLLLLLMPVSARSASLGHTAKQTAFTYSNPVIPQNAPDPSIIKALDGYYYLAASSDFWQGGGYHILPVFRSTDLVHWAWITDALP